MLLLWMWATEAAASQRLYEYLVSGIWYFVPGMDEKVRRAIVENSKRRWFAADFTA